MAGKIRVYELARELGVSNKDILDLCDALGIGVKSHSSSVVEAQADRVRRKAEREGIKGEPVQEAPAEAAPEKAAEAPKKVVSSSGKSPAAAAPSPAAAAPSPVAPAPVESKPEPTPPTVEAEAPAPPKPAAPAPKRSLVTSSGSDGPPRPPKPEAPAPTPPPVAPTPEPTPRPAAAAAAPSAPPATPAAQAPAAEAPKTSEPAAAAPVGATAAAPAGAEAKAAPASAPAGPKPPLSPSGKAIPPPPGGRPLSPSGKPIPPPPPPRRGPAPGRGPGGPGGARPGGGPGGARPGGGPGGPSSPGGPPRRPSGPPPRSGRPPSGGPRTSVPGAGGRGRPGGNNQRPRRRKGRRRRRGEELQPIDAPSYTPIDAPVPDGEIVVERSSTPQDLGPRLNRTAADVVKYLMQQGEMVTATQSLSDEMIELFAAEIGAEIRLVNPGEEQEVELRKRLEIEVFDEDIDDSDQPNRPPVITVMGHVDHGKTLLLDRIRNANVVDGEAGGITQHIGAYQVEKNGTKLTFIDTPGHEAFTAMRARGADATDIVILMVAADDGVMPQTAEAIDHARAADVPIVVALNKIDRDNADPNRVMQQLSERDLVPESWGGDTIVCEISALQNVGIDELLENLSVVAELEDLRVEPEGRAQGVVLESNLDVGRGPVATVLVQRGELKVGDALVAGAAMGRVRALIDDKGNNVKIAGPSMPVQVLGLNDVALAGSDFVVAPSEKVARDVASTREHWHRQATLGRDAHAMSGGAKLEDIFDQIQAGETATLNLIVKADVQGSLEATTESLKKLERDEVKLAFVLRGVGRISENDIQLAAASNATILGFNVRPDRKAREMAEAEGVEIRTYEIIYKLLEDIEAAMLGMLAPVFEEVVTGDAEVREIFRVPRIGAIAGCMVQNGTITRGSKVRFLREGTIIWKGSVQSLRRFKDDVREVASGFECGIGLSDFQDLKPGDIIETFEEREVPRV